MDTARMAATAVKSEPALGGAWLWIGRFCWLLLTVLVLLVLSEIGPENYRTTYGEWVVSQTRPAFSSSATYRNFVHLVAIIELLSVLTTLLVSFLIFWHKSHDKMGVFVSATLVLVSPWFLSSNMEIWRLPTWVPFASIWLTLLQAAALSSLTLFFYLFPNGRFYPSWTRWPAALTLLLFILFVAGNFVNIPSPFEGLWFIYVGAFLFSLLVAGITQLHRYRTQTDPVQRQQMKWVIFAISLYTTVIIPASWGILGGLTIWGSLIELLLILLASWLIPLAVGFSILRYRLWEIDLLINRTAVYGVLTALVIGLYILLVGVLSRWLQLSDNPLIAALATGLVAILFEPLRRRLQQGVNRLMYGEQDDPLTLLSKLGARLGETAVPETTLLNFVETLGRSLKLPYVAILSQPAISKQGSVINEETGKSEPLAMYGKPTAETVLFFLVYQGEQVGQLVIGGRGAGETFSAQEQRLLENVARQAGTAVYAARLTADLQQSRERLVTAREEERRRIRRDLHDGLGPQLASLTLKLDATRNLLKHNPQQAEQLLVELKTQAQTAVSDIRQLVYDLRPPALDQLGLVSALREYAASHQNNGLYTTIEAPDPFPPLPAAIEVALYRIATEAIANVWHHAQAHTCAVHLFSTPHHFTIEVADDGVGLPDTYQAGVGLLSMRERTAELGGHCTVERRPEGGTRVFAMLPIKKQETTPINKNL